ncbi:MAG: orotidine-5'-phosphate decarboxylase [Armatimonadota bacterium]
MPDNFADRLMATMECKGSRVCLGLDPRPDDLPNTPDGEVLPSEALMESVVHFCERVLFACLDYVAAVKLQSAFFEQLGMTGTAAFHHLAEAAQEHGLITIADVKRGDIGSTAEAYAEAYLGGRKPSPFDAVTLTPYFGVDSIAPFAARAAALGKGLFVVVRASNPSAAELQDLRLDDGRRVHEAVADLVVGWGQDETLVGKCGYSAVGAVVGATARDRIADLRQRLSGRPLLVPGYGAQGAGPDDVVAAFDHQGLGAIVNSSRGILYAYKSPPYAARYGARDFAAAAAEAARNTREAINEALRRAGNLA